MVARWPTKLKMVGIPICQNLHLPNWRILKISSKWFLPSSRKQYNWAFLRSKIFYLACVFIELWMFGFENFSECPACVCLYLMYQVGQKKHWVYDT